MNLAKINAVLVAGVDRPDLIECWRAQPAALGNLGLGTNQLDLDRLRLFAGLAVKVRHNNLRAHLPRSFRLMSMSGIEIALFSDYAVHMSAAGRAYSPVLPQRAADFVDFCATRLDLRQRAQSLLWDALRFETANARLGPWHAASPRAAATRLSGTAILHELQSDPRALDTISWSNPAALETIELGARYFCFWRAAKSDETALLELDEFGYFTLDLLDAGRSNAEIARTLALRARDVERAIGEFAALGIVETR